MSRGGEEERDSGTGRSVSRSCGSVDDVCDSLTLVVLVTDPLDVAVSAIDKLVQATQELGWLARVAVVTEDPVWTQRSESTPISTVSSSVMKSTYGTAVTAVVIASEVMRVENDDGIVQCSQGWAELPVARDLGEVR